MNTNVGIENDQIRIRDFKRADHIGKKLNDELAGKKNAAVSRFSGFVKILKVQRILLMTDCFLTEKVGEMHGIV